MAKHGVKKVRGTEIDEPSTSQRADIVNGRKYRKANPEYKPKHTAKESIAGSDLPPRGKGIGSD